MRTIALSGKLARGRVAVIDDEDYSLVSRYRWTVWERTREGRTWGPYAIGGTPRILMHNLLLGRRRVDHVNHNGLDNRRDNLRPATAAQNNHNQRPVAGSSSIYKGVTWHRQAGKWQASLKFNGKYHYLGLFESEADAALAYNAAAIKYQGEYAYLNEVAA